MIAPEYLLIGHVTRDETPDGPRPGGTVSYAGHAASAMGARVAIVTSAHPDDPVLAGLPQNAQCQLITAPETTVFVNTYEGDIRRQHLLGRAATLSVEDVPAAWRRARIVHLGPLDDEVDPALVYAFPDALVAVTPQGWMRAWDGDGLVSRKPWADADRLLPVAGVTIFSEDDIGRDSALEAHYASLSPLMIVTRAAKGCTVYRHGVAPLDIPAPAVPVVDATGAGDVFAGVFLVMMGRTGDVIRAAEAATYLASMSVTRPGLEGAPVEDEIRAALAR